MTGKEVYGPSRNWEVIDLSGKIKRYVIEGDDSAKIELLNQVIAGEDLAEALGYLKLEIKEIYQNNEKEENKPQKLINYLEEIIKGKEGTIIKEIKKKIKEYQIGTAYNQDS